MSFECGGVAFRETHLETVLGQILIGGNERCLGPVLDKGVSVLSIGFNPYAHGGVHRLETF